MGLPNLHPLDSRGISVRISDRKDRYMKCEESVYFAKNIQDDLLYASGVIVIGSRPGMRRHTVRIALFPFHVLLTRIGKFGLTHSVRPTYSRERDF